MSKQPLKGKIALVTGATRGIGRGVAIQLGKAGALVYITGRTLKSNGIGSLEETSNEIRKRGGECIPVQVDHQDDKQICDLFKKIDAEQKGRLDILVNNVYKAVTDIFESNDLSFFECKPEIWDDVNNVGLRNHYICTVYAARLMTPRKQGLIVNISSYGGAKYIFNVAYGIGKAAVDRMAADCGIELKKYNVAMISLYPGAVKTELVTQLSESAKESEASKERTMGLTMKQIFDKGESTEFSGKVIVALASDPQIMNYTSKVVVSAEYAYSHGIKDIDNRVIPGLRDVKTILAMVLPKKLGFLAEFVPQFIRIPRFLIDISESKFYR